MIIAVDFDGTLCLEAFPLIGEVTEKHKIIHKAIKHYSKEGHTIILWTCRTGDRLREAVEWCKEQDIPIDYVNENVPSFVKMYGDDCRKICADIYIDDRAVHPYAILKGGKV